VKYVWSALIAVLLFGFPPLCQSEVTDRIVAIVNDDIVTLREVERYVAVEKKDHYASMYEYVRNIALREKIATFVEGLLISQQAKKLRIEVTDKEVEGTIGNIKKQNLITDEQLREQLKKEGINYKDFAEGIRSGIIRNKVLARTVAQEVAVDDKTLLEYYVSHRSDFIEEEYNLQHIFVSGQREDGRARAREALKLLDERKPFENVAKEFSDDPSKDEGGDIGFAKKEDLMAELRQAIMALAPGSYTRIIETPYGFHIMKLKETKKGKTENFEDVKSKVREMVYQRESQKRYKEYLAKLKSSAYIEMKI